MWDTFIVHGDDPNVHVFDPGGYTDEDMEQEVDSAKRMSGTFEVLYESDTLVLIKNNSHPKPKLHTLFIYIRRR